MEKIISEEVLNILNKLIDNGYEAYVIGGAVRQILFDRHKVFADKQDIKDFDIVTSATPEQVEELFYRDAGSVVTCGNNFLVTLIDGIEVATYRTDKADSAEVAHTLKEDVARRDFTINAIAWDIINGEVVDYNQGVIDLDNRILRFIGEPSRRITEDPVRMLRGIRFASQYNLDIEKETFFAIFQHRYLLKDIPAERIQQEIVKAFKHNNTHRFLTLLEEFEMLDILFPNLQRLRGQDGGKYHNETVLNHCFNAVRAIDDCGNYKLKLASLYHDMGKYHVILNDKNEVTFKGHNCIGGTFIEYDLKEHLKFSNDIVDYVVSLSKLHMDCIDTKKSIRKLMVKLTEKNIPIRDFILLRYSDNKGDVKESTDFRDSWKSYKLCIKVLNEKPPFNVKSLAINGKDVMERFNMEPSPRVGEILRTLFEKVIDETIQNTREDLMCYLEVMSISRLGYD